METIVCRATNWKQPGKNWEKICFAGRLPRRDERWRMTGPKVPGLTAPVVQEGDRGGEAGPANAGLLLRESKWSRVRKY